MKMGRLAGVICMIFAGSFGVYWLSSLAETRPATPPVEAAGMPVADLDTSTIVDMVLGSEDAPVQVIEYASYTCPHCADFHKGSYQSLKRDFIDTGKIRFVYREVYFNSFDIWASIVARCGGPGKFFAITDLIFETQPDWTSAGDPGEVAAALRKIGRLAGADLDRLETCLEDKTYAQTLVARYQENAARHGIRATPSFVVNGRTVSNQPYDELRKLIEDELGN